MEIVPASMAQVRNGRGGNTITVTEDVGNIAKQVNEIDPSLSVHWNEGGGYFSIQEACQDGKDRVVLTTNELDERVIRRLRYISSKAYDYLKEIDRIDNAEDRRIAHKFAEETGEIGERLHHALRKDKEFKPRIFVPEVWRG